MDDHAVRAGHDCTLRARRAISSTLCQRVGTQRSQLHAQWLRGSVRATTTRDCPGFPSGRSLRFPARRHRFYPSRRQPGDRASHIQSTGRRRRRDGGHRLQSRQPGVASPKADYSDHGLAKGSAQSGRTR
ncbi:hypothetical protein G6F31_020710 [Rhizopus arrhizus]|nr:hypothetical protein G6F31_020710 [Rhizopus arrhizus]